jgi:CubicO group peptidase (beta-lactamase class C family)
VLRRRAGAAAAVLLTAALTVGACSNDEDAGATDPSSGTDATTTTAAPADFSQVGATVDRFVQDEGLDGAAVVVVDREDGIVHEHYAGEFGPDRVSLIASSSKMLTAGVLMRLDDEGLLDVDAPIADAVQWPGADPSITPAQLVSNSSGLVGLIDDPTYPPYICQYLAVGELLDCGRQILTTDLDDADVVPPDTRFRYGGGQWQVAGAVAEAVSGRSWAELIRSTYVEPCGVDSLGYNNHFAQPAALGAAETSPFSYPAGVDGDVSVLAPTDNPNMEGGAYITPPDYAALLLMHLRDGRCGDTQVLSPEAVERMHADRVGPIYGGTTAKGGPTAYGLGWWVDEDDPAIVEDGGAFGAVPWLDLDDGYGVYVVVEATNKVGQRLADELAPLVEAQLGSG